MVLSELLDRLGYLGSENFLRHADGGLDSAVDYAHIFRRAAEGPCNLNGVYVLRQDESVVVPVVYVCQADTEQQAEQVHKLVWNQNTVPFLIVNSPETIRVYPGFCYPQKATAQAAVKTVLATFSDADGARIVDSLSASAVDNGQTWRQWGKEVTPEHRVDRRLLENLRTLDEWLQGTGRLKRGVSHALIGKYVYLHYLWDRKILSPTKLADWGIPEHDVFGRDATIEGVEEVTRKLDEWLNGSVFPIDFHGKHAPEGQQLRRVAATFAGDELEEDGSWQLHLAFEAYDFSYIPIETLSIVYQQFLHAPDKDGGVSRGRATGAYYTPMPVVNFMLAELEEHRPLTRGMRVFDASCGSGAFLVQCYRRLIEKEFSPGKGNPPKPTQLRELLKEHIFGVDSDADACSVTELSLILTLLDYVHPPDLATGEPGRPLALPKLRDQNIFCDNFFHEGTKWDRMLRRKKCSWIVGNPPWKQLNPGKLEEDDGPLWNWIAKNRDERPVGSNQTARAFAWRVAEYSTKDGEIAMFLPAMTLFEDPAKPFRKEFFRKMKVHAVANFANLAEVISDGRFRVPAAAFFYRPRPDTDAVPDMDEVIRTYSPLVANQEPTRPVGSRRRNETWSLVINASEIRDIPTVEVLDGKGLPWKIATWGSRLDIRLLRSLAHRFAPIGDLEDDGVLLVAEGLQLRRGKKGDDSLEAVPEVVGKKRVITKKLRRLRDFFVFPDEAVDLVDSELDHGRKGRAKLALTVCRPPHVIVSAARHYAIYSDEFLVVPGRQIGIVTPSNDKGLLKAISLFLSSDFAFYHQFLTSTQFGVKRDVATLRALREMPLPVDELRHRLDEWVNLHTRLVRATRKFFNENRKANSPLFRKKTAEPQMPPELLKELNVLTYDSLGLPQNDRALVRDLVRVRLELNDGKLGEAAVRAPSPSDLRCYARLLKSALDTFVEGASSKRHKVDVVYDDLSGMVRIDLKRNAKAARDIAIVRAGRPTARELERTRRCLRAERAQWVYFDRNLRIYEGTRTFVLKPMQQFHWLASQARVDAHEIIAETLEGDPGP